MQLYEFTVVLDGVSELTDDLADKLFDAGCDDGTPSSCNGIVAVDFGREAADLETAIRSAIANVSAAGLRAKRVEIAATAEVIAE